MKIQGPQKNSIKMPASEGFKLKGNILLAEDNPINQKMSIGMLQAIGCQVHVVNNGLQALKAFAKDDYDLILMDCHLPEMDGFQTTIQIRQRECTQPKQARVPIIALTDGVQNETLEHCLNAGMDSYLNQPFSMQQLQTVLEKWMPMKHTEPDNCNLPNSENNIVNSKPAEPGNLRTLTPSTNDRFPIIKILLIDDDPNFRLIASKTLRASAFYVDEAANGAEALEKIKHQLPDIVILDSMMKGINGFQTCRLLKTDPAMTDVPIIMSTGRNDNDSIN
jgi:CheY-like chemotaxis protein